MQKLKNFSLVSSTSKLYSENKDSYIFLKVPYNVRRVLTLQVEENNIQEIMEKKAEDETPNEDDKNKISSKGKIILYKPLKVDLEISKFLTRIHENLGFNSVNICAGCNRFLEKNRKEQNCSALVPRLYSSRALIPFLNQSSNNVYPSNKFKDILNISIHYKPRNSPLSNPENSAATVHDYVQRNPSKFALSLSEIWEEMKEQEVPSKSNVTIEISGNCRSCPAVVSIKNFKSNFSPRRTESKVLLLSCDNFSKFENTFTKLLAKNKIRNIKPLLQKMENKENVLTKLERAFINHNLRINKNKDKLTRNVIVMQSNVMENIREQLDSKYDNEEINTRENISSRNLKNIYSKTSNQHMERTKKPKNIMIVNDEIFRETTVQIKGSSQTSEERNNILYLNSAIFKELKKEEINRILSRKYTKGKDSEYEISVMIPTRQTSKKLKQLRLKDKKDEEHQEVPLENLISAVADKKRLEYIERSKMNWKVFEEFEKTMQTVTILNFPPPEDITNNHKEQTIENEVQNSELPKKTIYSRKRKRSVQEKKESKFVEDIRNESPCNNENVRLKIIPKIKKVKEKRITSSQTTAAINHDNFKIHNLHRITESESMEKEKTKSSRKSGTKSPNTKRFMTPETKRSNKEKTRNQNTLKTKRQDKTSHSVVNLDESKKHSKMDENKDTKSKNKREGAFRQREEIRVVRINKSPFSRTMENNEEKNIFINKKNSNPEKNEHRENYHPSKSHEPTIKNKKGKTANLPSTRDVISSKKSTLENLVKKTKGTLNKEAIPEKEEFKNLNENRNLYFDEEEPLSLKEGQEKDSSLIFIHKAPIKSTLSSSSFDIAEDFLEKPNKKEETVVKSRNVPLKKKLYSTDPVDETENKLRVDEPIGSFYSAKIVKTKKPPNNKSKLPILGTPTTITKHIEKIVASALATNNMEENEKIVNENINNSVQKAMNRQKNLKLVESEGTASNDDTKDKVESENIDNFENKSERDAFGKDSKSSINMEIEKIDEEKRLDIDEILAMASPSLVEKVNGISAEKKKLNNENKRLNEDISIKQFNEKKSTNVENEKNKTRLPTKNLKNKKDVPTTLNTEEFQNENEIEEINMRNQKKNMKNDYDLFKGDMDEFDGSRLKMNSEKKKKVEHTMQNEIFKQIMNEDSSIEKLGTNMTKNNTDREIKKQNDFMENIHHKNSEMNENENNITMEKNSTEETLLEKKIVNNIAEYGFPKNDSISKSQEQWIKNREIEQNGKILHFGKDEKEKQSDRHKGHRKISEKNITIYERKTKDRKVDDDIDNKNTTVVEENEGVGKDETKSISSVENMEKYEKLQMKKTGYESCSMKIEKDNSQGQFIMYKGFQQKEHEGRVEGEIVKPINEQEKFDSETGENKTTILEIYRRNRKIEDSLQNNGKKELEESESISSEKNQSTKPLNQSTLGKTTNFSSEIKNEVNKIAIIKEKIHENSSDNFIEIYFRENQVEDFDIFETNSRHKKTEISEEKTDKIIKPAILGNKGNEMKTKPTDGTISIADPEVIRKKRLIYFGDNMKNNLQKKRTQVIEDFGSKPDLTQLENKSKKDKKISLLQPERSIENASQTSGTEKDFENSMVQTDQGTDSRNPIENEDSIENEQSKEKRSSSSQYDSQPYIDRSEKAIETEIDHKDAAVIAKTESVPNGTKNIVNHKILKHSVSDNVIILKAARTDSEETVESVDGITKSFLKQVQSKMNIVQNSKLKNRTMQKCRDIIIKLKKSQEKIVRNIPSSLHKIYQEARKIKSKLSRTKIIPKKSREILNKFTNTLPKSTMDTANQVVVKDSSVSPYKPETKVKSVIERTVTSKMRLLTKTPNRNKKRKRNISHIKPKFKKGKEVMHSSPSSSMTELQNKSLGSLFADTVASALARCGDVNQIMDKYSDTMEKSSSHSESNRNIEPSVGESKHLIQERRGAAVQKEDEFLMNDGIRKLVLTAFVEKNEDSALDDEWNCCTKVVLQKKPSNDDKHQSAPESNDKYITIDEVSSSTEPNKFVKGQSNLFLPIFDDAGRSTASPNISFEQREQGHSSKPHLDDEVNALEETRQDLTKLKILLQEEKEKTGEKTIDDIFREEEKIVLIKNNETFTLKILHGQTDTPKSLEDLHEDIFYDRDFRKADGSTSPPPNDCLFREIISNETSSVDFDNSNSFENLHGQQMDISEREESLTSQSCSTILLQDIDITPKCLTLTDAESREIHSPEVFVTPLTSNTDFEENSVSIEKGMSKPKVLPLINKEDHLKICKEEEKNQYDQIKPTIISEKSSVNKGEKNSGRKDEIELKSSNYQNSLIFRESKRKTVKAALENCEVLEQRVENVLEESFSDKKRNEIFTDLERTNNSIVKTVPSKDKVSVEEPTRSRNTNLKNYTRSFATDKPNGSYSRFRDTKPGEDKDRKKDEYDLKALDELHDETLDDDIFFGREIKRRKKELNEDIMNASRKSVYLEIVRSCELNEMDLEKSEEIFLPVENEQNVSENSKKIQLDTYKDDTAIVSLSSLASPQYPNQNEQHLSNSEKYTDGQVQNDTSEEIFSDKTEEVSQPSNPVECQEQTQSKTNNEENTKILFESVEESKEVKNNLETEEEKSKEEDIRGNQKQIDTSSEEWKHKILKKFAQITQEQDSAIFRINNDVKFDLHKKRMCQPENIDTKRKRSISLGPSHATAENLEKPIMIIKLSSSREMYKPVPKMTDTDLRNLLVQNPKMLMKIASDIMSKNQYLSFLLDLKSSKELKEYWMNKIKEGIVTSRSFRDLTKVMDYFKVKSIKDSETDLVEGKKSEHDKDLRGNNSETGLESEHDPTKKKPADLLSTKSDIGLGENKTIPQDETGERRYKTSQSSQSSIGKAMLKRDNERGKNSRRNLCFEHKNQEEDGALPYTLEKYLESPLHTSDEFIGDNESSKWLRISKNLHGKEVEMEIAHEKICIEKEMKLVKKESGLAEKLLPMEKRVEKFLFKLTEEKAIPIANKQKPCNKFNKVKNKKSQIKNETNDNIKIAQVEDQSKDNIGYEIFKPEKTKSETVYQANSEGGHNDKKINPQQTAIVLPGREPMKISLISNEISLSQVASIKDRSEKNVLENLSDVLSNCSSPLSSLSSKDEKTVPKKRLMKNSFKRNQNNEIQQSEIPSIHSTVCTNSLQKAPAGRKSTGLRFKKYENPLKEFVRNHDVFQPSTMSDQLSKKDDTKTSPEILSEETKIQVIKTKSLSEVLKEDPDFLRKIREKKMFDANKEEEAAKRFEYRFHDFRRKEDKCLEMKVKRQEEQKKDLLTKFKRLIEARKVAAERNRQNIRSSDNQQIQPKVFSKILEKISYFKELEEPENDKNGYTVSTERDTISTKRGVDGRSPRVSNGNRRMMHTKRKQINEDELVTWVQEHPAVPEKRVALENGENLGQEKQNVIHIPWTPTSRQEDT